MKKVIIVFAALGLSALNLFNNSYAQNSRDYARKTFRFSADLAREADDEMTVSASYLNDISTKAVRTFQRMFKDAHDVRWTEEKGTFYCRFKNNEIDYRNFFTKNGYWIAGIQTYSKEKLPRDVRSIVGQSYYDYTITLVEQVDLPDQAPIYIVHLDDGNSIKNIGVQSGEVRVYDEYEKAN